MNVKFAVSTWLWTSPFSTESISLFPKIREMGFDGIEIAVEDPDIIDLPTVKAALEDNALTPLVCGAFGPNRDLTHENHSIHEQCFQYIDQCFEICNFLDAKFLAGPMYSAVGKARQLSDDQRKREFDLAVTNLQKVCDSAQSNQLAIALEPLNRFESDLINTAEDLMRLIDSINHPAAMAMLDSFHMTIEEKNLQTAVNTVSNRLVHVQVSENHRGIPGTGQTQWTKLRKGLEDVGYTGFVSIESFTPHVVELADAVCIWKPFAPSQDVFAQQGLQFLRNWASNE